MSEMIFTRVRTPIKRRVREGRGGVIIEVEREESGIAGN